MRVETRALVGRGQPRINGAHANVDARPCPLLPAFSERSSEKARNVYHCVSFWRISPMKIAMTHASVRQPISMELAHVCATFASRLRHLVPRMRRGLYPDSSVQEGAAVALDFDGATGRLCRMRRRSKVWKSFGTDEPTIRLSVHPWHQMSRRARYFGADLRKSPKRVSKCLILAHFSYEDRDDACACPAIDFIGVSSCLRHVCVTAPHG